jgi:serine/threonine protein kinase
MQEGDVALLNALRKTKKLGEGAQGCVWQCEAPKHLLPPPAKHTEAATPGFIVLKEIRCTSQAAALERYHQSLRLMQLRRAHLVHYYCVSYDPNEPCPPPEAAPPTGRRDAARAALDQAARLHAAPRGLIVRVVMPFYDKGSLTTRIADARTKLGEQWLLSTLLQLVKALEILHAHRPVIAHCDVKPDNILLYGPGDGQVLLMDLESSCAIDPARPPVECEGTYDWLPPGRALATTARDVWSLGVLAYCLAVLPDYPEAKHPTTKKPEMLNSEEWDDGQLYWTVHDNVTGRGYTKETADIIAGMLRRAAGDRPSVSHIGRQLATHMENLLLRNII